MTNVLITTSIRDFREQIQRGLVLEGMTVIPTSTNVKAVLDGYKSSRPSIMLIDLPLLELIEVCKSIRARDAQVGILALLKYDAPVADCVAVLDEGADDCLIGSPSFLDVLAKMKAVLRRGHPISSSDLKFQDLSLNTGSRLASRQDRIIELSAKEYRLLELFLLNPNRVLSRDEIQASVWDDGFMGKSNVIEVYIRYLRIKTEVGGLLPRLIHTVRGMGYALRLPAGN